MFHATIQQHRRATATFSSFQDSHSAVIIKYPDFFPTSQVNIYEVSTVATVAIQNEMHVISPCNTHILITLTLCTTLPSKELACFVSRTILAVIDHMQKNTFSLSFPDHY